MTLFQQVSKDKQRVYQVTQPREANQLTKPTKLSIRKCQTFNTISTLFNHLLNLIYNFNDQIPRKANKIIMVNTKKIKLLN